MTVADRADALRDALAMTRVAGDIGGVVRDEIACSWRRSYLTGLQPDRFEVPNATEFDADALLTRAARPVLDQLADDLVQTRMTLVLTDSRAQVLERRVPDRGLQVRLDGISLAPGFVYAEELIGTNAIGTALAQRGPSAVNGHEHFADALTTVACAAAPVADPRNGQLLGAVDLTCAADDAGPLMLALAKRAAREIEQRLLDDRRVADQILLQRFLRERRGAKGPLVFVNGRTMITNAAADRLLEPADEAILWDCARQLLARGCSDPSSVVLSSGVSVAVRCEPVLDGSTLLGALLRVMPGPPDDGTALTGRGSRRPFGWESLTDTERSVIELVAQGCTNREAGQHLFLSAHTVGYHLRSIFRKLDVRSRVDLARVSLEHHDGSVDRG